MSESVKLIIANKVATILFDRPEAMNAFNYDMAVALDHITSELLLDDNVRAVCLRGAGNLFMAGGDIKFFQEHMDEMPRAVVQIMRLLNSSIHNLKQLNKPVVATVHGSVAGVGLSFMLACDLVLAAEGTKFTTAYSKLGLSPDGGASYFLPRVVGSKKAMELFLLGEVFDSAEALRLGLINWVVPMVELESARNNLLTRLAQAPTCALANTRQLVQTSFENSLAEQLEHEVQAFMRSAASVDFKLGVQAFLTKSKPEFTGK